MTLRETIKKELCSVLINQYSLNAEGQWFSMSENAIEYFLDLVLQKLREGGYLKDGKDTTED